MIKNTETKRLSIIIVTYNSDDLIINCLESIFQYNDIYDKLEVIIVDNNSKNASAMFNKVKSLYNDEILLIHNKTNGGYGEGNNIGVKSATSPIILIMNPDVVLIQPIFKKILYAFERNDTAILGMQQYESNLCKSQSFLMLEESVKNLLLHKFYAKINKFNKSLFCLSGACFAIRKSVFNDVGMFDEQMFLYGEERLLHYKILSLKNWEVLYDKSIGYLHPKENREFSAKNIQMGLNSYIYVCNMLNFNIESKLKKMTNMYRFLWLYSFFHGDKLKLKFYSEIIKVIKYYNNKK